MGLTGERKCGNAYPFSGENFPRAGAGFMAKTRSLQAGSGT